MAWTTPRTWVTGETVTAAHMNANVRDNGAAAFPNGTDWQAWTPTLPGITQGNGTIVARWTQVGKTVHAYFVFTFGTTSAMGTGIVGLPVTASSSHLATVSPVGPATFQDATGPQQIAGLVRLESTTTIRPVSGDANNGLTSTAPFTWASTDRLTWSATYEAA